MCVCVDVCNTFVCQYVFVCIIIWMFVQAVVYFSLLFVHISRHWTKGGVGGLCTELEKNETKALLF